MTEKVISSTVLGSANPIARKFRNIKSAISGIGCGVILLLLSLVLIYQSVFGVKEYSKIVEALPMMKASEVGANNDLVKISDTVVNTVPVSFTYEKCLDKYCAPGTLKTQTVANLFNYTFDKQRYEIVKHVRTETRTTTFAGEEVEEQVEVTEYKEEWVSKESKNEFAKFSLGNIVVQPSAETKLMIEATAQPEVQNVYIANLTPLEYYGQVPSALVGNTKITMSTINNLDGKQVIVVGRVMNSVMSEGDPFIITMQTEAQLIESLKTEETFQRVALLIGSWLAIFIGLGMLLAPILELVDWIPLFGGAAKFAAGVISFIVATVVVLSGYFLLRFWYIFLILLVLLIAVAIYLITKPKKTGADQSTGTQKN